jgi:hypothetical protein
VSQLDDILNGKEEIILVFFKGPNEEEDYDDVNNVV